MAKKERMIMFMLLSMILGIICLRIECDFFKKGKPSLSVISGFFAVFFLVSAGMYGGVKYSRNTVHLFNALKENRVYEKVESAEFFDGWIVYIKSKSSTRKNVIDMYKMPEDPPEQFILLSDSRRVVAVPKIESVTRME